AGQVRVNKAGCLDRCDEGPVLVIYPAGVWYTVIDTNDIEEIIQTHLIQGQIVDRLQLA
ncbi:MAG: (2Fe-2S) ferredoxin domain-containing protein, partial [Burkholderiaceae bacterium]|nr:(2Fe-2S) ferredoxin domain-containing protein [Burkholderiaceae bacterium]